MYSIFSSYIHEEFFNFNTKEFKEKILKIKFKDKGRKVSNYGGWQSNYFVSVEKPFENLFNKINFIVEDIKNKLNINKKLRLINFWHNVNGLGSFNAPHEHGGTVVSGVYYVSIPKNAGSIVFLNKDLDSYYSSIDLYNQYNSSVWKIEPKENMCVLFPSYLQHYVEPNLNKKERISISFNYGF